MQLEDLITKIPEGQRTILELAGDATNRKVTFELQRTLPPEPRAPLRAESPRRRHEFLSAASLGDYLAKYGGSDTVVYADPVNEVVSAVLDERAGKGFEVLTMKPAPHPLWKPWAGLVGRALPVLEFAAFVMEHRRAIVKPDGRGVALDFSQVRAAVKTEIHDGRGPNALNGVLVTTEIKGNRTDKLVQLPDEITIRAPLYVGTEPQEFDLDLCLNATPQGVTVLASAGAVAEARVAAFEEMVRTIRDRLADKGATLTLGRPAHAPWDYLRELEPQRGG